MIHKIPVLLLSLLGLQAWAQKQQNYFQQHVSYHINVVLNDTAHILNGQIQIQYKNNSPDTLNELYFHLYPNAYSNRKTALCKQLYDEGDVKLFFADEKDRGYMDSLFFKVNNTPVSLILDSTNIDIGKLILKEPLLPAQSITIETPFKVKIPNAKFSRLGHVGQSYMITQWYPKPAVYDQSGWHMMPYLSQGEFYSEYGSYDVTISLPENYVVAATGYLQNESEWNFINHKIEQTKNKETFDGTNAFPASSSVFKTIRFVMDSIHDFAWFADKRFNIATTTAHLKSGNTVSCYAYFTDANAVLWKKAATYVADAVSFYSEKVGMYPYSICSAVDGTIAAGGGMEYPSITVIGNTSSPLMLDQVITHEVGHNWFYGILGSNERVNPWMDEGMNSYYEMRYMTEKYGNSLVKAYQVLGLGNKAAGFFGVEHITFTDITKAYYQFSARFNNDQPGSLSSEFYTPLNYAGVVYSKTALCFDHLNHYLGEEVFNNCMQAYFNTWKFKHPDKMALQSVFEETANEKFNWFFNDLLMTDSKADFKIKQIRYDKNGNYAIIKNKGNLGIPVQLRFSDFSGNEITKWIQPFKGKQEVALNDFKPIKTVIDAPNGVMDINPFNNFYKAKGLKQGRPIQMAFLTQYENPDKLQLFYIPALGYNVYNGLMLGVGLHNYAILGKNIEFGMLPMFSFGSKSFAGIGTLNIQKRIYSGWFDYTEVAITPRYFLENEFYVEPAGKINQDYWSLPVEWLFRFRKTPEHANRSIMVKLTNNFVRNTAYHYQSQNTSKTNYNFSGIHFMAMQNNPSDPGKYSISLEQGKGYVKTWFQTEKELTLTRRKKDIYIRFFAGTFIYANNYAGMANFRSSAWSGRDDYQYNYLWSGRNESGGFWSHQMIRNDGGMIAYYPVKTDKWMASLNVTFKTFIPGIKLFGDMIAFYKAKEVSPGATPVRYDAGVMLSLVKEAFEVYFPLIISKEIKDFNQLNNIKTSDRIRFVFNISKLNPVQLRNSSAR